MSTGGLANTSTKSVMYHDVTTHKGVQGHVIICLVLCEEYLCVFCKKIRANITCVYSTPD